MLQKSQEFLEKLNPFTALPNLALSLSQMLKYTFRATDLTIPTKLECLQAMAEWETGAISLLGKEELAPGWHRVQPAFHPSPGASPACPGATGWGEASVPEKELINASRHKSASVVAWFCWEECPKRLLPHKGIPLEEKSLSDWQNVHDKTSCPAEIAP